MAAHMALGVRMALVAGILSSLLYVAMTVLVPMQWVGYSSASQTISELSAVGAPTRSLWVLLAACYTVLVTAFGLGIWRCAPRGHVLRIVGSSIVAYGAIGLAWPFAPMHLREVIAAGGSTLSDTMHLVLASVTVLLMLGAIAFGAAAFGTRFRAYSMASIAILVLFGALTFLDAPALSANLPTPWLGVWERINVGVFLLWVVVLAATLLRLQDTAPVTGRRVIAAPSRGAFVIFDVLGRAGQPKCRRLRHGILEHEDNEMMRPYEVR